MKFYLQWDGPRPTRAYKGSYTSRNKIFYSINDAMAALKKVPGAHRLCYDDPKTRGATTLVFFEGASENTTFTPRKLKTLSQFGKGMYVPTRLTRKTNIKRKKKCSKKSSLLSTLKASAKSTQ